MQPEQGPLLAYHLEKLGGVPDLEFAPYRRTAALMVAMDSGAVDDLQQAAAQVYFPLGREGPARFVSQERAEEACRWLIRTAKGRHLDAPLMTKPIQKGLAATFRLINR